MGDALARFKQLVAGAGSNLADAGCELLLAQLEPSLAQRFRLCAIPHQFDLAVLKVLLPATEEEQILAFYEKLPGLALVNTRRDGLALHDIARSYLFGKWLELNNEEFRQANGRLQNYFGLTSRQAQGPAQVDALRQRMFHWIGADQAEGMAEFERLFRENRQAARLSDCAALIALVHEYDPVLSEASRELLAYREATLAAHRNDWKLVEERLIHVLESESVGAPLRLKAYNRLGLAYLEQRKWDDAIAALEHAKELASGETDGAHQFSRALQLPQLPLILHDMAVAYRKKGLRERSQKLLDQSIRMADRNGDLLCLARDYNSLGTLHRTYKEHREAIAAYTKSLEYLDRAEDRFRRGALYNNLGDEYSELADWTKSREFFELSLQIGKESADTFGQARALTNLVRVYLNGGQLEEAIAAGKTAASYFGALQDYYNAGLAMLRVARALRSAKRKEAALQAYAAATEAFQKAGASSDIANVDKEQAALVRPPGLPWWAWTAMVLVVVSCIALIVAIAVFGH